MSTYRLYQNDCYYRCCVLDVSDRGTAAAVALKSGAVLLDLDMVSRVECARGSDEQAAGSMRS